MTDIDYHATNLAQSQHALAVAEEKHQEALSQVQTLKDRIAVIVVKCREISERRVRGEHSGADLAEFSTLHGDVEVLKELLERAEEQAEELEPHSQRDDVKLAEAALAEAEKKEILAALQARARKLEGLFVACMAELARHALASGRINLFDVYRPSAALKEITGRTNLQAIAVLASPEV